MEIIIISGRSGAGKSVALRALEDMGYYCVDNLPLDLPIFSLKLKVRWLSVWIFAICPIRLIR